MDTKVANDESLKVKKEKKLYIYKSVNISPVKMGGSGSYAYMSGGCCNNWCF